MGEPVRQPSPERAEGRKTWEPDSQRVAVASPGQDKRGLE